MAQWQKLNECTPLWSMYEKGLEYQAKIGLREQIKKNIAFFEGNQWASPTESTKNLPRPVVNIVKMICRSKKASILATPLKIIYKSYTQGIDISRFNSFASGLISELGQSKLDRLGIEDAVKKGSYFFHYYWDPHAISLSGRQDGSVRCEIIDPLCIFFENPAKLDEQSQKWILISSSLELADASELSGGKISDKLLENDANENGNITVLTRYFRIGKDVYFEKGTKSHILVEPTKLSPSKGSGFANLYPIVCGYYEKREGSIYGISEIEGLIPNQKAINFNIAMSLLNSQECAWGKYIILPGALKDQKISNVPGQVLIDYSGTGQGIKKMSDVSLNETPMNMSELLISITRSVSGATELLSGEAISASLSGTAIAQLQAQAQLPIDDLKNEFIEVKKKQGLVLAQFMKLFFYEKDFITKKQDENGVHEVFDTFSSSEYESSVLDVIVEVTNSSSATVAADISFLNTCLSSGSISLETYIKAYPDCAISNKTELLEYLKEQNAQNVQISEKQA